MCDSRALTESVLAVLCLKLAFERQYNDSQHLVRFGHECQSASRYIVIRTRRLGYYYGVLEMRGTRGRKSDTPNRSRRFEDLSNVCIGAEPCIRAFWLTHVRPGQPWVPAS